MSSGITQFSSRMQRVILHRRPMVTPGSSTELSMVLLCLIRPNRPLVIVDVQFRIERNEFHVRFVQGVDVPYVAPVVLSSRLDVMKRICKYPQPRQGGRNDVLAEIMVAGFVGRIIGEHL